MPIYVGMEFECHGDRNEPHDSLFMRVVAIDGSDLICHTLNARDSGKLSSLRLEWLGNFHKIWQPALYELKHRAGSKSYARLRAKEHKGSLPLSFHVEFSAAFILAGMRRKIRRFTHAKKIMRGKAQ